MQNIKRMLLIGVLATTSIIGSGCSKSNTSIANTETAESTTKESQVEETRKKQVKKNKFEHPITLGTIGGIDLMADSEFPKAGFFETNWLIFGFNENKGELASCFFQQQCVSKEDTEIINYFLYY